MHMQASLKLIPEALLAPAGKQGWREFVRICPGVFYSSCLRWQIGTNLFTVHRSNCDDQWEISPESRNNKRPDSCCLAVVFSCCNLVFSYSLTFGVCFRQRSEKHRLFVPYCLQTGSGGFQYLSQASYWNPVSHPSLLPPPKSTGSLPEPPPPLHAPHISTILRLVFSLQVFHACKNKSKGTRSAWRDAAGFVFFLSFSLNSFIWHFSNVRAHAFLRGKNVTIKASHPFTPTHYTPSPSPVSRTLPLLQPPPAQTVMISPSCHCVIPPTLVHYRPGACCWWWWWLLTSFV